MKSGLILFFTTVALITITTTSHATVYTWTGAADGDWTNIANWDVNGVPVDDSLGGGNASGLTIHYTNSIVFSGATMPSSNVPGIGGNYDNSAPYTFGDSPTMFLNSGGAVTFAVVGYAKGFWLNEPGVNRTILTIGDGVGGGSEDVVLNITGMTGNLRRHGNGTHIIEVNSDGTLNFVGNLAVSYNATRPGRIEIDGGTVDVDGFLSSITSDSGSYIRFREPNGSFTADYGGDFADIAAVSNRLGTDFKASTGYFLYATDNGGSFTVEANPYTWRGTADNNWSNSANWFAGLIPVDSDTVDPGLSIAYTYPVVFSGTNLPTSNVPSLGGKIGADTPTMIFKSGGTINITAGVGGVIHGGGFWTNTKTTRTVLTVGDGIGGGGTNDVTVNVSLTGLLLRHTDGTHNFHVNADGTLNFDAGIDFYYGSARFNTMTIDGGSITVNGTVRDVDDHVENYISFTDGGSFTAGFGGDFASIEDVRDSYNIDFLNNSGWGDLSSSDNGDGSFTVSITPKASLFSVH